MSTASPQPIGLIGLGLLGSALADRLFAAGEPVVGFDVHPQRRDEHAARGGLVAASALDVVHQSAVVMLSLPTDDIVRRVLGEAQAALRPGLTVLDTTTGEPGPTAELGEQLRVRGVDYLDATVSGSSADVRAGAAVIMCGGRREAFDSSRPLLDLLAKLVIYAGPVGSGAKLKLVTNLVLGLNRAALAEGLSLAGALGLDLELTLDALRSGAAYARCHDTKGQKMIQGDFTPQARLAQHHKDVRLILAAAQQAGLVLPLSQAHDALLKQAEEAGFADADNSAVIRAYDKGT